MNSVESPRFINAAIPLSEVSRYFAEGNNPVGGLTDLKLEGEPSEWSFLMLQPGKGEAVHVGIQQAGKKKGEVGLEFKVQQLAETDISSMRLSSLGDTQASALLPLVIIHQNTAIRMTDRTWMRKTGIIINESPIVIAHNERHSGVIMLIRAKPDLIRTQKTYALTNPKGKEEEPEPLVRPDQPVPQPKSTERIVPIPVPPMKPVSDTQPAAPRTVQSEPKKTPGLPPAPVRPTIVPRQEPAPHPRREPEVQTAPADEAKVLAELKEIFLPKILSLSYQILVPEHGIDKRTGRQTAHWYLVGEMNSHDKSASQETLVPSDTRQKALEILRRGVVRAFPQSVRTALSNDFYSTGPDAPAHILVTQVPIRTEEIKGKGFFAKSTYRKVYDVRTMDWNTPIELHPSDPGADSAVMITGAFSGAMPNFMTNDDRGISESVVDTLLADFATVADAGKFAGFCLDHPANLYAILRTVTFDFPEIRRLYPRQKFYSSFQRNQLDLLFTGPFSVLKTR